MIDESFLFNADIEPPLILRSQVLRTEAEYDEEKNPERTALQLLKRLIQCVGKRAYLVIASQGAEIPNRVRSYKGLLWNQEELRLLEHDRHEVEVRDGRTRLVAVVDLQNFSYASSDNFLLSWTNSFLFLSEKNLLEISEYAKKWIDYDQVSILPFNFRLMAKDLRDLDSSAILRYFPADNGHNEMIAIVGDGNFIESDIEECLESM